MRRIQLELRACKDKLKEIPQDFFDFYIYINKRKIKPRKPYNTEKKSKNNETVSLKNNRFALLDNQNSTIRRKRHHQYSFEKLALM